MTVQHCSKLLAKRKKQMIIKSLKGANIHSILFMTVSGLCTVGYSSCRHKNSCGVEIIILENVFSGNN